MQQKVLVTGATGFIGNYVVEELLKRGYAVVTTSASAEKAAAAAWYGRVVNVPFNFNDFDDDTDYFSFFQQPGKMIHLAWEGLPNYKDNFHLSKNLPLQKAFLSNLLRHGLKDITVTGTCFEYGMKEGRLSEMMETEPANPYAVAKDQLRIYLEQLAPSLNCSFKWVRLFYMYGKGQSPKSLISQLDKAVENGNAVFNMSGGEQQRDFLPIEKVAAYIADIALQNKITGIINCCSGKPVTVKEFVAWYLREKNKTIQLNLGFYPYPDYEPMRFWGDDSKLKMIINE
ncbi:MAG: NAD-dependent epimerase/dehydratase family protein [Ferruginibacter sp.]